MKEATTIPEGNSDNSHAELILNRLVLWCISITGGISSLALAGWFLNWLLIARIDSAYIPMAQSTALSFVILSFALFVYARKLKHSKIIILSKVSVFLLLLVCSMILLDFLTGAGIDIEQLLYSYPEKFNSVEIGRMSPITAAIFLLSACAFLLLMMFSKSRHRAKNTASSLGLIVGSAGMIMVLGYLYGTPLLYGGTIIPVALTTAIAFVFLGIGLAAAAGQHYFPVNLFAGSSVRARLMRAFVPVTIAIVLTGNFISSLIFTMVGNYVLASSLTAILSVIFISFVILKIAGAIGGNIDRADAKRRLAEEALKVSEDKFRSIFNDAIDGIMIVDAETTRQLEANKSMCDMLGYSREELVGLYVDNIHPKEALPAIRRGFEKQRRGESSLVAEIPMLKKDGSVFYADVNSVCVTLGEKQCFISIFRDISERKQAEEERRELIAKLQKALDEIRTLRGIIPICSYCKKIRDDKGAWDQIEAYVTKNTYAQFSHGVCPECFKKEMDTLGKGD